MQMIIIYGSDMKYLCMHVKRCNHHDTAQKTRSTCPLAWKDAYMHARKLTMRNEQGSQWMKFMMHRDDIMHEIQKLRQIKASMIFTHMHVCVWNRTKCGIAMPGMPQWPKSCTRTLLQMPWMQGILLFIPGAQCMGTAWANVHVHACISCTQNRMLMQDGIFGLWTCFQVLKLSRMIARMNSRRNGTDWAHILGAKKIRLNLHACMHTGKKQDAHISGNIWAVCMLPSAAVIQDDC